MKQLVFSKPFIRDYQALPDETRAEVDKALTLLLKNQRHPSLQSKKMQPKSRGIFEARATQSCRMTFHLDGTNIIMRRAGTHDILRTP
jgi:mRNA-degrading endonuclease YafQ of YafQ-DinJ toxin-antitoxin module